VIRLRNVALAIVAAALVAGCARSEADGAGTPPSSVEAARADLSPQPADTSPSTAAREREATNRATTPQGAAPPPAGLTATPSPSASPLLPGPRPTEAEKPMHTGVPIQARLQSRCVQPGQTQRISILTQPNSGVVYDAVYSDGKYGGTANYYGGNAGGRTDARGQWSSQWVVARSAPAGPVRIDVAAATPKGTGYATAWFHVAGVRGGCS
jgi:hypothetical protein